MVGAEMGESTRDARQKVVRAREGFGEEVAELALATRSAVDIPAKVRRHPVRTAGIAGGAVFLAANGPKRVLRAVERRVAPRRSDKFKGILPKEIEKALDRLGDQGMDARERLEAEFADWVSKRSTKQAPSNARQSFWKTYDAVIGPLAALGVKRLLDRLFAAEPDRPSVKRATNDAPDWRYVTEADNPFPTGPRRDAPPTQQARPGPAAEREGRGR